MQKDIKQIVQHYKVVVISVYMYRYKTIHVCIWVCMCVYTHNFTVNQVVLENQYTIDSWEANAYKIRRYL